MIERLAIDANAAIDMMRVDRPTPHPLAEAQSLLLPLPVLGELFTGALASRNPAAHLGEIGQASKLWTVIAPDEATARIYGEVRVFTGNVRQTGASKLNDLWIAALCLQHNLPLLTNDRGFDAIAGLSVLHWDSK
jgi:tRNA(fMet)-specific endonuclease VapC